jgi:Histidine kinase
VSKGTLFRKLQKVGLLLTSTPVVSLIISVGIIISLPEIFNKYEIKLIKKEKNGENEEYYYADLDNNGFSERIKLLFSFPHVVSIIVYKNDEIIDQWNVDGKFIGTQVLPCGDVNGDGIKELFVFTWKDNKIYLNYFNPLLEKSLVKSVAISNYIPYSSIDERIDCTIHVCEFSDQNKDGFNEFYFSTETGLSVQPRKIFAFDFANDTLITSPNSCAGINNLFAFDLDRNGISEFITSSNAVGNCDLDYPYTDMYSWLMVLDNKMKFKFEPVKLGHYPSLSEVIPVKMSNGVYLAAMNLYNGTEEYPSTISLYNSEGRMVREKQFTYSDEWEGAKLLSGGKENPGKFFIIKKTGLIEEFDENLTVTNRIDIPPLRNAKYHSIDLDNDNQNEFIFLSQLSDKIFIARNDFSNYVSLNITGIESLGFCNSILNGKNDPLIYIHFDNFAYTIGYYQNPLYYLKYLIYVSIYFCAFIFVIIIQKTQKHRIELKYETERKITELQLKSIKNQTDPHFTLNLLNSIGSLFYKQDIEKANYIFGKYSKLLRTTILSSDKILIPLSTELDYVENYLELEMFRHNYKFNYNIEVDAAVDREIKIPKMAYTHFC